MPAPVSPTRPSVFPSSILRSRPLRALTMPSSVLNSTARSFISTAYFLSLILSYAPYFSLGSVRRESVAQKVQAKDSRHNRKAREQRHVAVITDIRPGIGQHRAPFGMRSGNTQTQEAQAGRRQNNGSNPQGGLNDQRSHAVGKNVAENNNPVIGADGLRSFDIFSIPDRKNRRTDYTGETGYAGYRKRYDKVRYTCS